MELRQPIVSITEAGSRMGRAVAVNLVAKGYRVFGAARSEQPVDDGWRNKDIHVEPTSDVFQGVDPY
jgi:NADP-dependent 3-hydroxy acid dehydrogenase YdfG